MVYCCQLRGEYVHNKSYIVANSGEEIPYTLDITQLPCLGRKTYPMIQHHCQIWRENNPLVYRTTLPSRGRYPISFWICGNTWYITMPKAAFLTGSGNSVTCYRRCYGLKSIPADTDSEGGLQDYKISFLIHLESRIPGFWKTILIFEDFWMSLLKNLWFLDF